MGDSTKEDGRPDIRSPFGYANWMAATLLWATSVDRIENLDSYVHSMEAIVFEIIVRNIDRRLRGAARDAYARGVAVGLYGRNSEPPDCAISGDGSNLSLAETSLLEKIRWAGMEHGRSIRQHIEQWEVGESGD